MTYEQARAKADRLNASKYLSSRIDVTPMKFGNTYVLVGVGKNQLDQFKPKE